MALSRRAVAGLTSSLLCALGLPAVGMPAAHAAGGGADIQITEIAYGGNAAYAGDSGDGEYVELTNVGDAPQDMSGWAFNVLKGTTDEGAVDLSGFGTVQPGESVIVTDLTPADFRAQWNLKPSVKVISDKQGVASAVTLDKGPDTINVLDGSTVADTLQYASGYMSGKGVAAYVNDGQLAATDTATAGAWTNHATVGDGEGSWTSAGGSVGSPAASTQGGMTPADVQNGPDMQITEVAYGGKASGANAYSGDVGDGEYVELTNVGSAPQDMTGWKYTSVEGSSTEPTAGDVDLSGFGTVAPGESVIITDLTPADFRTEWNLKSSVKVVNDGADHLNSSANVLAVFDGSGTAHDWLTYAAGYLTAKGLSAHVANGGLAATSTAAAGAWTNPSTVGDGEGSWTSKNGGVGSPGASTQGDGTPADVRAGGVAIAGANDQNATVNAAFSYKGLTATGGTGSLIWSATGLPAGLSIDSSTGEISGTPTATGVSTVTVTVTDTANATTSTSFAITVLGSLDQNWRNIVINEISADNNDNPQLTGNLPAALRDALNGAANPRGAASDLVEIYNKGTAAVDITGWKQIDSHAASNAKVFSDGVFDANGDKITSIPAHGYGVFESVQGLGSGGDAVQIFLPDGTLVDSVTYGPSQAGFDEGLDPTGAGPNATTEPYQALVRCTDGAGDVNTTSNSPGTAWYSVTAGSFGTSNDAACGNGGAVRYFNEQPPTGLPSGCAPSMPSGSDVIPVPGAVAWPTNDVATPVDDVCEFIQPTDPIGNDMSGLVFSADGSVLWGAQNKNHLWKLVKDPATGKFVPATDNGWGNGKGITFTGTDPNTSQVDDEGLTIGGNGNLFTTSERDNQASGVSRDEVLEFDPNTAGTTLAPVHQWDLTSDFVPSVLAATGDDSNLGFEGVTYVPDSFLTAHGFRDQHLNKTYSPADYPAHGGGLFFAAMEKNGHIYAYSLNEDGTFQRVADIDTGVDGTSAIADVQFNADDQGIWAHCDNDCGVAESLLKIDSAGDFTRVVSYNRPAGLPDSNFEGFAIAPASTAVDGKREAVWSDDGIWGSGNAWNADHTGNAPSVGWGHALFAGTIPVSAAPSALTGTVTATGTVGTAYTSPALTPTGGFPAVFSYRISQGALPAGLTLDAATGAITGTPTTPGTTKFTISVSNGVGAPATLEAAIAVTGTLTTHVPVIVGSTKVGSKLTVTVTPWGPAPVALTYQWYANGVAIKGATTTDFHATGNYLHETLTVVVTGTKADYTTVSQSSAGFYIVDGSGK